MRSFIIAGLLLVAAASPLRADDVVDSAVGSERWLTARLEAYLVHVGDGDYPAGEACYRDAAEALAASPDARPDDVALLRELASMSASLAMPKTPPRPRPDLDVDLSPTETLEAVGASADVSAEAASTNAMAFVTNGRTELVLTSTLYGGYLGVVSAVEGAFVRGSIGNYSPSALDGIPVLLFPLVLGGGGLLAAGAPAFLWDEMSAGDAHLLRAAEIVGVANSLSYLAFSALRISNGTPFHRDPLVQGHLMLLGMGAIAVSPILPAVAGAYFLDVPEGGPSLGITAGALAGVLSVLGVLAAGTEVSPEVLLLSVTAVSNLAFLGGLTVSYAVPVSRVETWAIDLGAIVGFLGATALAFGLPAPNPVLGWGGMAMGTLTGGALGLGVAKLMPYAFDVVDVDRVLELSPLLALPVRPGDTPPVGLLVTVDTGAFER